MVLVVKNPPAIAGDLRDVGSIPGSGRCRSRKWQPTPVFLPGKFHRQEPGRQWSGQTQLSDRAHNLIKNNQAPG